MDNFYLWIYVKLIGDIDMNQFEAKLKLDYEWSKVLDELRNT